jgi:hypothetical protein
VLKSLTILSIVAALVQISGGACLAGNQAGLLRVMPVASWGAGQPESAAGQPKAADSQTAAGQRSNNDGRQLAVAVPKAKETRSTENKLGPTKSPAKTLSASATSNSREFEEAVDVVSVTAKRLAKEGGMRFGEYSRWFSALFKQQQAPPVITPAAPNYAMGRLSHAETVTPKHPLWMLRDGRLKTVTVQ